MKILGIIDSKPSTAAVVEGGRVLSAVAEERLCRMKMAGGVPRAAIAAALEVAGVGAAEVDRVVVAQRVCPWQPEPQPWDGWFEDPARVSSTFLRLGSELAPWLGRWGWARAGHRRLKGWLHRDRRRALPALLREAYGLDAPVRFRDHHLCHAASAYYTCPLEPALVVTLDGGGDGRSGGVWIGRGGRLEPVASVGSFDSLGNLYSYVTHLSGFQAEKHEGKVTGLAAAGEPRYAGVLRRFVRYDDRSGIRYPVPMYHRSALRRLAAALPAEALTEDGRADLAASVQLVLEEVATAFVRHWLRRTGLRRLAVAGGVFANVKLNQRLHQLEEVDELWVHPAMDDGGLAVGGALLEQAEAGGAEPLGFETRLDHVYLGPGIGEREAAGAASAAGLVATRPADPYGAVAELLAGGAVVAVCTGAMEYGPRALGHRSILYRADDPSVDDWLNRRLRRSDFMPFAPTTLAEHAGDLYRGLDGARDPARFMTLTFDCTPKMRAQSPAVVHVDGTARPQLVDADTAPELHAVLTAYHRRTGVPTLINTSFNLHEEPIVCTAEEAVRAFLESGLDHLLLGPLLVAAPTAGRAGA